MAFLEEMETIIRTAYHEIVKKESRVLKQNVELNGGSYAYIAKEIKRILIECNRQGFSAINTTNKIIYEIIKQNYFVYSNHVMAAFIGYQYFKKMAQVKRPFSINGINKFSTIDDIAAHTITW